jgi:hypothetical protein
VHEKVTRHTALMMDFLFQCEYRTTSLKIRSAGFPISYCLGFSTCLVVVALALADTPHSIFTGQKSYLDAQCIHQRLQNFLAQWNMGRRFPQNPAIK